MISYLQEAEEKDFMDLVGNPEFDQDLKNFFQGGRYNYSDEEVKDTKSLARDFVQHMRWQSMNEVTAAFDLLYIQKNDKEVSVEGQESFAKLIHAMDVTGGGGTGKLQGAWDYATAGIFSPSTGVTLATFGFGVGTKIAAKAAAKATQMSIRKYAQAMLERGITKKALQENLKKQSTTKAFLKGGAGAVATEAPFSLIGAYSRGETREEAYGKEYTGMDLVVDTAIDSAIAVPLGGFGGAWNQSTKNKAMDVLIDQAEKANVQARQAAKVALSKLSSSNISPGDLSDVTSNIVDMAAILRAREAGVPLEKLSEDKVKMGQEIFNNFLDPNYNGMIAPGLDMNTIRGIAAASIELKEKLNLKPGQRITEAVADGLAKGDITSDTITQLRKTYNLSAEELSYVWMAELSKAGSILAEGSKIRRAVQENIDILNSRGASVFTGDQTLKIVREAESGGLLRKGYGFLQDLDSTRIAFMTSQLGTTAANVVTGTGNTIIDMSDAFWTDVLNSTVGVRGADGKVTRRWTGKTLSVMKGFTTNRVEAEVLGAMLLEDSPEQFASLFYESQRIGDVSQSSSFLNRGARFVNTLNMATDAVFKQGAFYGAVDRRLRELNNPALGSNFKEYLELHTDLNALRSSGILSEATDYAKRFTFQRGFEGDNSLFGKGAQEIQRLHKQLPFVVSSGLDMPFPRYIANHLEYINDYTPIGIITGGLDQLEKLTYKTGKENLTLVGDMYKTGTDRTARQMTGAMLTMGGVWAAAEKQGEIDYSKFDLTGTGAETDVGRVAGPWAANLLIGDWVYRSGVLGDTLESMGYTIPESMPTLDNPLPFGEKAKKDLSDVLGGMTDLGFDPGLVGAMVKSIGSGKWDEDAQKKAGDIIATFTYPATIARDVQGQLYGPSRGSPYTRDVRGGDTSEDGNVSLIGERNFFGDMFKSQVTINQMTRFIMDTPAFSITQSNRNENGIDLKKYNIFSPTPVGGWNPITKQFGFTQEPPSTGIQKELNRLGIPEYTLYGKSKVENPAVDYAVSKFLALGYGEEYPTLAERFDEWRSTTKLPLENPEFAGQTYDELTDNQAKKRALVEFFVNPIVQETEEQMTEAFTYMFERGPGRARAAGFVRNMYLLEQAELEASGISTFDDAVMLMTQNEPERYNTALEFLQDSSDIEEEMDNRMRLIKFVRENYSDKKTEVPPVKVTSPIPVPIDD